MKKNQTKILIGYFEDINGKNAIPLKNIEITKAEILAIIEHHVRLLRSVDNSFNIGMSGSWEIRQMPYSNKRIKYYSQFVEEEEIKEIFDRVYKDFKWNEDLE